MKARLLILSLILIFFSSPAEAQILKKLKKEVEKTSERVILKKTEEKTEKTVSSAFDSVVKPQAQNNTTPGNRPASKSSNPAKSINTEAKRAFYTSDVIVKTSDSVGKGSSYYFDSDELAARGEAPDSKGTIYIDSEGFNYAYNEGEGRWEKTGLMSSDAMAFMMPAMSMGIIKLPVGPTMDAAEKLKEQGLNMNTFQIVEWAFIYKPEHFRNGDYQETTAPCPDGGTCPKFLYTNPENKGSWVLFDSQDRISEVYAKVDSQQAQGTGNYKFSYEPVSVSVPEAVEVKMPFQDLFMAGADATPPGGNNRSQGNDMGNDPVYNKSMPSNARKNNVAAGNLPATYDFDWEYQLKMEMPNQKQDALDLIFLLKKNSNYQGIKMKMEKSDEATMVFDSNINALVMFMQSGNNKILQIHSMQDEQSQADLADLKIRELPDKTIIGYKSKGVELENNEYIAQVYHTSEAPIEMSTLFNSSGSMGKNLPNIDPGLIKRFSEGLVTEMHYTDKKNSKNSVLLTAQSLNQIKNSINTAEYQNMSFMGQLKSKN
ncbi:hypothetical protein GCM10023115_52460 [Pontixanthobacter gangjinensis]|uniref:DUF4412 domain-containing protein n=1 Tax=Christiangramia aestuarii TaxID=1028746 RepID=A0A7K1LPV5_9FLAO|nr:hypothetical protein [Christiangramia aestuarii]MUP42827.1 hypothetical protein [Christiangramia aestuarii]